MKMRGRKAVVSVAGLLFWLGFAVAQNGSQPGSATAVAHIQQGSALLRAGQAENALQEFQAALAADPDSPQALTWLGITQNQLGRFQDAASTFRKALKIDPSSQAAHYNLGLTLARLGKNQDAIREMREVLKTSPPMAGAQYNLAVLLEHEGKYNEAIALLKAALEQRRSDEDITLHLVNDDFKSGADNEAVQLAQNSFHNDTPGKTAARLGALLVANGHFNEAVPMLESAVRDAAPQLELTNLLGRAYVGAGSPGKAIDLLQPLAGSDPSGEASYLLGLAYSSKQQPRQAVDAFRLAADRRPADVLTHAQLGSLLLSSREQSDQAEGIKELNKAIDLAPHEGKYYAILGRWLLVRNQESAALPVLRRGVENAPPSAELYLLLGVAEASLQSTQLAQPTLEKAIALDPKIALSHDVLGFCYFRVGDYAHAAQAYKVAHELSPGTGRFAYDTALALERENRAAEAISYAQTAARLDPSLAMDHYLLGKLYGQLDRKPEAVQELTTSIRLDPALDYPYYQLARMYMRLGDTARAQEWNLKFLELKKRQMTFHGEDAGNSGSRNTVAPAVLLGGRQMDPEATAPEPGSPATRESK